MGILNVTPDSFSDGGSYSALEFALSHAEQMIADGVDIIDIGGESTRPGIPPVPLDEELRRVMPVIYALRDCGKPLSIDTYKPEVMREALIAEVDMINDINGFRAPGAIDAVKDSAAGLCIMHMQGEPQTMQLGEPAYGDVVGEVRQFLEERVAVLTQAGIARGRISVNAEALAAIAEGSIAKGDVLATARIAGIMAAKRTADIIPLCHPLPLASVSIDIAPDDTGIDVLATARTAAQTGVEMEAMTAAAAALLTLYDMLKALDKRMVIGNVRVTEKRGGKSGDWTAP